MPNFIIKAFDSTSYSKNKNKSRFIASFLQYIHYDAKQNTMHYILSTASWNIQMKYLLYVMDE